MCMAVCTCRHPTLQVTFAWLSLVLSLSLGNTLLCVCGCVSVPRGSGEGKSLYSSTCTLPPTGSLPLAQHSTSH